MDVMIINMLKSASKCAKKRRSGTANSSGGCVTWRVRSARNPPGKLSRNSWPCRHAVSAEGGGYCQVQRGSQQQSLSHQWYPVISILWTVVASLCLLGSHNRMWWQCPFYWIESASNSDMSPIQVGFCQQLTLMTAYGCAFLASACNLCLRP